MENGGYAVDESLQEDYLSYIEESRVEQPERRFSFMPELPISDELAGKMANETDIALITIGRNSDLENRKEEGDFNLTDTEKSLIQTVSQAFQAKAKGHCYPQHCRCH